MYKVTAKAHVNKKLYKGLKKNEKANNKGNKNVDEANEATADKFDYKTVKEFPGLVVAVVGDSLSLVPKPWNTIKFTSSLKKVMEGANNSWLFFRGKDNVTAHIKKAFLTEDDNKDSKQKIHTNVNELKNYYVIVQKDGCTNKVQPVQENKKKSIPTMLDEISKETTPLFKRQEHKDKEWFMLVPVVMVVVEGDMNTIKQVLEAVKKEIPVCVIKGSGEAADCLADSIYQSGIREIKRRAARHFGVCFGDKFDELEKNLNEINKHGHLVSVYDVNDPKANMEKEIVDVIINAWSFKKETQSGNKNSQPKSITKKVVRDGESELMTEYQFRLNPGSLSLYFYIAYQYLQEQYLQDQNLPEDNLHKNKQKKNYQDSGLKLLLVEAIAANRVDYVSSMLQNGVEFDPKHLSILYDESVVCPDCDGIDCIETHSIHNKLDAEWSRKIWCSCKNPKNPSPLCRRHHKAKEQNRSKDQQNTSNGQNALSNLNKASNQNTVNDQTPATDPQQIASDEVLAASRHMCQLLLEHEEVDHGHINKDIYQELLAWALILNKVELASVFWSKCKGNQLLAAIMASSLLKNMAGSVDAAKYRKLKEELLHHSMLFETRVIDMQTSLYEEKEIDAIKLMDQKSTFWGIHISPMECAFENNMIDVIGHPCIQRKLDRIWYNRNYEGCSNGTNNKVYSPDDVTKRAAATKLTHWFRNLCCCCCYGSCKFMNSFVSPLSAFITHYLTVLALLVIFSAFILTNINTVNHVSDIGVYEWLLYVWLVADIVEEYIVPLTLSYRWGKPSKKVLWFKFKRTVWNFWNFLKFISHLFILAGVVSRYAPSSINTDRITLRLFSLGLFTMYMRFLQCMLVQSYFGPKLIMIGEMLIELIKFVWILIIFMMCTGVLYHANMYPSHYDMWSPKGPKYWRIWKIISLPYWQIYGELFLEELQGDNNDVGNSCTFNVTEWEADPGKTERCVEYDWSLLVIAALYLLITNLLLVNLIIALFSYRFDEVQKDSDRLWKFSRYSIIITYRKKHPVPYNIITFVPRLLFRCVQVKRDDDGHALLINEQESHAIRCLETRI